MGQSFTCFSPLCLTDKTRLDISSLKVLPVLFCFAELCGVRLPIHSWDKKFSLFFSMFVHAAATSVCVLFFRKISKLQCSALPGLKEVFALPHCQIPSCSFTIPHFKTFRNCEGNTTPILQPQKIMEFHKGHTSKHRVSKKQTEPSLCVWRKKNNIKTPQSAVLGKGTVTADFQKQQIL